MNLRYIYLNISHEYYSGINEDFSNKFGYNTCFIGYYLSKAVRKEKIETGIYNMIYVLLSAKIKEPTVKLSECFKTIEITIPFDEAEQSRYIAMDIEERYEFYLTMLEKGYYLANIVCDVKPEILIGLHEKFRQGGYRNEWLFKKKRIKEYGINVVLDCVFTSFEFKLMLTVLDLKKNPIAKGCIYHTYPDYTFFYKTIKHLVVTDKKMIITDFLDYKIIECKLEDLAKGIIKAKCIDKNTSLYIYSDETKEDFERLRW